MVKKIDLWGNAYHEPPYTEQEQLEMYQRMSGVVAFTRPSRLEPFLKMTVKKYKKHK